MLFAYYLILVFLKKIAVLLFYKKVFLLPMKKAILLHHAGGDKFAFDRLRKILLPEIESITVELPGRGERFGQPLLYDYKDVVADYFQQIKEHITTDYFLVGVSMGTMAAFELCHFLLKENLPLPTHLFLAARLSPNSYKNEESIVGISSEEYWKIVKKYNGIPEQLLAHKELVEFYEPILRADFEVLEKYNKIEHQLEKINLETLVIFGKEDTNNITLETAQSWSEHITQPVIFKEFEGGHFFVYENEDVAAYIKSIVLDGK